MRPPFFGNPGYGLEIYGLHSRGCDIMVQQEKEDSSHAVLYVGWKLTLELRRWEGITSQVCHVTGGQWKGAESISLHDQEGA